MAGHSHAKNIMYRKGAQDAKKAKQFTKLIREIMVAVRTAGVDPQFNPRLRTAIVAAKTCNLPKDKIENAIKKASAAQEGDDFEEITYECYAPGGIALVIEVQTDSRNRASSDIRSIINKYGATQAELGSVLYMFDRVGIIVFNDSKVSNESMLEAAIEAGADECVSNNGLHEIYCKPEDFHKVREFLTTKFGDPNDAKLYWKPKNIIVIDNLERAEKLLKLIEVLEDCDDVQYVCGNYEISDTIAHSIRV